MSNQRHRDSAARLCSPLRIAKLGYSSAPWRLLRGDDDLYEEVEVEHPTLGMTRCHEPVCGSTKAEVIERVLCGLATMRDEVTRLRGILREIEGLASWHCDETADPEDTSPEDHAAHINGLIVQACRRPRHMRKATKTEASAI